MEPFCRGVFGSRSSVPSQCVAELRTTSLSEPPCVRAVPTTPADRNGCMCRLLPRPTRPSPNSGRVGIRIVLFEACSGFTRVTARTLAQPPKAAFVTGLRRSRLPATPPVSYQLNRQLAGWNPPPQVFRAFEAHQRLQTCMLGLACLGVHGPCRLKLLATEPPLQRRQFSGAVVPKRTLTCCTNLLHNQCEAAPRGLENIGFFGTGAVSCSRHQ